jgi:hypothetical protein
MVEIREEPSEGINHEHADGAQSSTSTSRSTSTSIVDYLKANAAESFYFVLRIVTIYFTALYVLPLTSASYQKTAYSKAFLSAAATNAFRLHQRMRASTTPTFSRQFLQELMLEDSAHYLLYCVIFASSPSVTMALLPIFLYALLHSLNFIIKTASETGHGNSALVQKATEFKGQHTANILGTIACAEIFVFPIFFAMIFMGRANIFFPFLYFRFLSLRYVSRRNPYTRMTFANLKMSLFNAASRPACPGLVRNIIYKTVGLIERFAPQ